MRRLAWCAIPLLLFVARASTVTGALATQSRTVTRAVAVEAVDDPAGIERRHPLRETLAALRSGWPVPGPVNSSFGRRGSFWGSHFHKGVDIGARRGTPVHAPASGTVAFAGWRSGYGRTVVIDHGGQVRSLYGHLSKVDVRSTQRVVAGAAIGRTGTTGNASGSHLHYEILVKGHPVNPR